MVWDSSPVVAFLSSIGSWALINNFAEMKQVCYRLREGVKLEQLGDHYFLSSELPLTAIEANKALYALLLEMRRSGSFPSSQRVDVLERLVGRGFLIRDEFIEPQTYPTVSIIVPVKNRPQDIEECLNSLVALDYPKEKTEIIAVNDGSSDSTAEVINAFEIKTIHLRQSAGASSCRNLAAHEARGELLAFIDSDCVADPHWLKELVPYFEEERMGIVGGHVSNFYNKSSLDRYEEVKSSLTLGSRPFRVEAGQLSNAYVPSCNLIIRKKAFDQAGGFQRDLRVGEDVDLCWRTGKLGYHLLYVPRGRVDHKHRNHLFHMLRRRYDYGTSEGALYSRHKDKRKILSLSAPHVFSYGFICIGMILLHPFIILFGLAPLLLDYLRKGMKIKEKGLNLKNGKVFLSVLRSHFSFSYSISCYLVRYYLIFLIPLSPFYPRIWIFLTFLVIFSAVVDFIIRRPKINLRVFFFFFTLEQFAYQTGVFAGCFKKRCFSPYLPVILGTSR